MSPQADDIREGQGLSLDTKLPWMGSPSSCELAAFWPWAQTPQGAYISCMLSGHTTFLRKWRTQTLPFTFCSLFFFFFFFFFFPFFFSFFFKKLLLQLHCRGWDDPHPACWMPGINLPSSLKTPWSRRLLWNVWHPGRALDAIAALSPLKL